MYNAKLQELQQKNQSGETDSRPVAKTKKSTRNEQTPDLDITGRTTSGRKSSPPYLSLIKKKLTVVETTPDKTPEKT